MPKTKFSLQDSTGAELTETNKTPTASNDIRFSLNDVDNYTEKQYNDFGWVHANDVLSANQYNVFTSNYADAKKNRSYFNRTKSGEYMIPVHELYGDREGIDDTIVFARGDIDSPVISRIIKIDLDNETELSQKREEIFENESRGIQTKIEGIFRRYSPLDFKLQYIERNGKSAVENNNESGLYGRRSGSKTSGIESIRFNEDGSQEVTYKDGRKETRFSLNGKPSDTAKNKDYANRNNEKVYSKKDAEELLNEILADADPIVFDRSGKNGLSQENKKRKNAS